MIQGRWYGFGFEREPGWRGDMSHVTVDLVGFEGVMEVVSRAWEIARLFQEKVSGKEEWKEWGERWGKEDVLVDLLIVVKTRVSVACVQTTSQRHGELTDESVIGDAEVAKF